MKQDNYFQGAVVDYVRRTLLPEDELLATMRRGAEAAGLPLIEVAPEDGALLGALVRMLAATRVVEVGTLFGYSGVCMARHLAPGGTLITVEADPRHATMARANFAQAGLADRVTVLEGRAQEVLGGLAGPVDLVFIDADKEGYPDYLAWARGALRPGGVVAADNAFMQGRVAAADASEPGVRAMRRFLETLSADPAWQPAMVPTLEGLALAVRM